MFDVAQFKFPDYDPDHYEEILDLLKQHKERGKEFGYTEDDINEEKSQLSRECRAYGRLKECGREDLSIKCYGYILLEEAHEKELAELGIHDWRRAEGSTEPIMAIVKEYIEVPDKVQEKKQDEPHPQLRFLFSDDNEEDDEDEEKAEKLLEEYWFQVRKRSWQNREHLFQEQDIPNMMEDLHSLQKLGIWVGDIKPENYLHGKIIDFSSSLTMPAFSMDLRVHGDSSSHGGTFDRAELNHVIREYYQYCLPEKENRYEIVIEPRYQTRSRKRRQYSTLVTDPGYYGLYSDGTPRPVRRRKAVRGSSLEVGTQSDSNTKLHDGVGEGHEEKGSRKIANNKKKPKEENLERNKKNNANRKRKPSKANTV